MNEKTAKIRYIIAVLLFGANPIFIRFTDVPSDMVALVRSTLGLCTLLVICLIIHRKPDFSMIRKKAPVLIAAGACLALNWLFLFEAYATVKVSLASLCNYLAPTIAVMLSPLVLKESLKLKQVICVLVAFLGIVFVSGVFDGGEGAVDVRGIIIGLLAAASFVGCIFTNKNLKEMRDTDSVICQLFVAMCILIPYVLIKNGGLPLPKTPLSLGLLLFIGIVNAGFAYLWYYGPMPHMSVQSIAILGYIEPVECILLSVFLFAEPISVLGIIGAVLILGAAMISEINPKKKNK